MSSSHSLLVDATGSIATKLTDKEIFYFAFISYDRSIQTEPVPHLEFLTDLSTTNTLKFIFMRFLEDEMKRFNYISFSVPLLCTTDFSWPIIKSLVEALNNESVETYLGRSYLIVTGKATINDLPVKTIKTFLHISLCHSMKALARKVNKCFKAERNFVKYCLSLLVNSCSLSDALCVLTNLFKLLLYKFSDDCTNAKSVLDQKVQSDIEKYKELKSSEDVLEFEDENGEMNEVDDELPMNEDVYLQQSKRSIYFKKCELVFKQHLEESKELSDLPNTHENEFFSPTFAAYILNNWCGILSLWTSFHLGDQGRHGSTGAYLEWSKKFAEKECIKNPPRTQGIVEMHNKSVKHITLNSKRDRIDRIISNLYISKKSKHRQYTILLTRKRPAKDDKKVKETMPKKISVERWGKCKKTKLSRGPGFFQKNLKKCCVQKPDDWQRLSIIAWGGDFEHSSGKTLKLTYTCPFDNFFQILYSFYSMNMHHMRKLFEKEDDL